MDGINQELFDYVKTTKSVNEMEKELIDRISEIVCLATIKITEERVYKLEVELSEKTVAIILKEECGGDLIITNEELDATMKKLGATSYQFVHVYNADFRIEFLF